MARMWVGYPQQGMKKRFGLGMNQWGHEVDCESVERAQLPPGGCQGGILGISFFQCENYLKPLTKWDKELRQWRVLPSWKGRSRSTVDHYLVVLQRRGWEKHFFFVDRSCIWYYDVLCPYNGKGLSLCNLGNVHFSWVNQLFRGTFSIAMLNYQLAEDQLSNVIHFLGSILCRDSCWRMLMDVDGFHMFPSSNPWKWDEMGWCPKCLRKENLGRVGPAPRSKRCHVSSLSLRGSGTCSERLRAACSRPGTQTGQHVEMGYEWPKRILTQMLHVWNIYLHLGDFWGKCR